MILRVFRARAAATDRGLLLAHLRDVVYPANVGTEGLRTFQAGIRDADDGRLELAIVSTWADLSSLFTAIGMDLLRPAWLEGVSGRLEPLHADHYELVGEELRGIVPLAGGALRIFTGVLAQRGGESFFSFARRAQTEQLDSGLIIASHIGRRLDDGIEEAAYVTVWRDTDAPRELGGTDEAPAARDAWEPYFESWSFAAFDAIARVPAASGPAPALLLADDERRYVFASPAAGRLLGEAPARLLGKRVDDIAGPRVREAVPRLWAAFLESGGASATFEVQRSDGVLVPVRYEARAHTPWRGVHASVLADVTQAVDLDHALAMAGIVARYEIVGAEPLGE